MIIDFDESDLSDKGIVCVDRQPALATFYVPGRRNFVLVKRVGENGEKLQLFPERSADHRAFEAVRTREL